MAFKKLSTLSLLNTSSLLCFPSWQDWGSGEMPKMLKRSDPKAQ
ncbi:hypothetical protein BN1843_29060 [Escherichia coli]|nr:hypothetical protein BN1843_29060 [Escherichia coli]